jgi:ProP effector
MNVNAMIELLATRWPLTFFVCEKRRRPLKIGIRQDIQAALGDAVTPDELSRALGSYCRNIGYLRACYEGRGRVDLNGNIVSHVTSEEAKHCAASLAGLPKRCAAKANKRLEEAAASAPSAPRAPAPARLSLSALKKAAIARRQKETELTN